MGDPAKRQRRTNSIARSEGPGMGGNTACSLKGCDSPWIASLQAATSDGEETRPFGPGCVRLAPWGQKGQVRGKIVPPRQLLNKYREVVFGKHEEYLERFLSFVAFNIGGVGNAAPPIIIPSAPIRGIRGLIIRKTAGFLTSSPTWSG
jgi:hypothetical protein